ncbi:XRE family transcriptional regulator [Micromonospora sp. NPDC049836]|uniref:XRE family transcriptional regulator n=1 Tax=Micromonospora sp. NPDC049836 TaxID=3364274 RepID=UPI00379B656F
MTALAALRLAVASDPVVGSPAVNALLDALSAMLGTAPVEDSARFSVKQLRVARGWSQLDLFRRLCRLAEADGERLPEWTTFKRNLCRWENGTVGVSPYYRHLLSRLFDAHPVAPVGAVA